METFCGVSVVEGVSVVDIAPKRLPDASAAGTVRYEQQAAEAVFNEAAQNVSRARSSRLWEDAENRYQTALIAVDQGQAARLAVPAAVFEAVGAAGGTAATAR